MKPAKGLMLSCLLMCGVALASDDPLVGAYFARDAHGAITENSRTDLRAMLARARRDGGISVWITFDVFFSGTPSPSEFARTQQETAQAFQEVVGPFVARGRAELLDSPAGLEGAPGKLGHLSALALRKVARHEKVKQIAYFPVTTD